MITDDMRAQIGCYQDDASPLNHPRLLTPNLDRLASESLLLKKAYAQFTLCGPSRTSILTGRRPDTNRIFDNRQYWRRFGGNFTTIPQYFKQNGYNVVGIGKVFHRGPSSGDNDPMSWSEPLIMPKHTEGRYLDGKAGWRPVSPRDEKRTPLMDKVAVDEAKRFLEEFAADAKKGGPPFFLALGFKKPHSSYVCPERFYDLYPLESEEQFLADLSWQTINLRQTRNLQNITILDDGQAQIQHDTLRHLRRGYFACVSYVDHLVGELLRTLADLDLADSTVVSFVADHGYHFGENGAFGKQTLHEATTHVPLMVRVPGLTDSGVVSESVVEVLDLFPTLVEATGLPPVSACPRDSSTVRLCVQGRSLLPLVANPKRKLHEAALSQITATLSYMRYSIRTPNFRYNEWARIQREERPNGKYRVLEMNPAGTRTELYDLRYDKYESKNLTDDPRYRKIKRKLVDKLHLIVLGS